jgi:hypothetical protein
MKQRGFLEGVEFKPGLKLSISDDSFNPSFPYCPLCSRTSATKRACNIFRRMVVKAAVRDGFSAKMAEQLFAFAVTRLGGIWPVNFGPRRVPIPTATRRRQTAPILVVLNGLSVIFTRIAYGAPSHGNIRQIDNSGFRRIPALAPFNTKPEQCVLTNLDSARQMIREPSKSELRKRSVIGDRYARAAIRWLFASDLMARKAKRHDLGLAEFVRPLFSPCQTHLAEFDLHWCGWNSERGRLRAGVPVTMNRPRGRPEPPDRLKRIRKKIEDEGNVEEYGDNSDGV